MLYAELTSGAEEYFAFEHVAGKDLRAVRDSWMI
jgi:hypothetical protein